MYSKKWAFLEARKGVIFFAVLYRGGIGLIPGAEKWLRLLSEYREHVEKQVKVSPENTKSLLKELRYSLCTLLLSGVD